MGTYETGAKYHASNDLILFTENTRELANLRDDIFLDIKNTGFFGTKPKYERFERLEKEARKTYIKELNFFSIKKEEIIDFCMVYLGYYEDWKNEQ